MNNINSFVEYCGEDFSSSWNLYLKKGKNIIHPYEKNETTKEEERTVIAESYVKDDRGLTIVEKIF